MKAYEIKLYWQDDSTSTLYVKEDGINEVRDAIVKKGILKMTKDNIEDYYNLALVCSVAIKSWELEEKNV
jgi:hypothetical protein